MEISLKCNIHILILLVDKIIESMIEKSHSTKWNVWKTNQRNGVSTHNMFEIAVYICSNFTNSNVFYDINYIQD